MRNPLDVRRDRNSRNFLDLVSAFDDMFNRSWAVSAPNYSRMLSDIQENDQAYVLSIDMPGVTKDDIQIQLDGNILTVSAEHREEKNAQEGAQQQESSSSRQFRQYQQSFTLPMTVSSDQIEAHYENGVLELYLPKSPEAQPKKIEIQSGKGGFFNRLMGSKQGQQSKAETQQKTAAKH